MKHFYFIVVTSLVTMTYAAAWQYPTEFFPDQEKNFDWAALKHSNAEFYIARLPSLQEVQKYRRNRADFMGKVTTIMLGPYMSYEPHFPTTTFTFLNGDSEGDHYEITMDKDAFPDAPKKTFVYSGSAIEIWRNDSFLVGMRPFQENQ